MLNCEIFVLDSGGKLCWILTTDFFRRFVINSSKNTCVKSVRYKGGLLTLISLQMSWNPCYNTPTDNYYCILVVDLLVQFYDLLLS